MSLTRRDRLANIIRNLCHCNSATFTVTIGNSYCHRSGNGRDDLDMLTDEALELVARDLIKIAIGDRRRRDANRAFYAAQQARLA